MIFFFFFFEDTNPKRFSVAPNINTIVLVSLISIQPFSICELGGMAHSRFGIPLFLLRPPNNAMLLNGPKTMVPH